MKRLMPVLTCLLLSGGILLTGCASGGGARHGGQDLTEMDLPDADVAVRTEDNGDVIQEYRVAGALRMVKITPSRGPAYYLYDDNGDGRLDRSSDPNRGDISPVYWKLYGW